MLSSRFSGAILFGRLAPVRHRAVHGVGEGFDHQRLAGIEMGVESAMGQPGLLHQVGDADAVRTLFPQAHGRFPHDAVVGFLLVFPGIAHGCSYGMFTVI